VWIRDGLIVAVQPEAQAAPTGFNEIHPHAAGGFIFPGFIELHNHLAYNVLPMWSVPKKFEHRGQWRDHADYKKLITGPMEAISKTDHLTAAICRYVECKALFGGTTTSQGITLSPAPGIRTHFKGLLRNCESTDDPDLNAANGTVADQNAKSVEKFFKTLSDEDSCYLLHLAEGIPAAARKHFEGLKRPGKTPAIALTQNFCGIHCTGLEAADFATMQGRGASMVWSPLSNLLLYGDTANVQAARDANMLMGIGADWSPSGSKSILGEFKVARAWLDFKNIACSDEEIIAMATRNAAAILKWKQAPGRAGAGTIEVGNIADITVIKGSGTDPYKAVLKADETDVRLVMVGGEPRFGVKELVEPYSDGDQLETVKIGGKSRRLNLHPANKIANQNAPELDDITLAEATQALKDALASLPEIQAVAAPMAAVARAAAAHGRAPVRLALDEIEDTGIEMRPLMGLPGKNKKSLTKLSAAAVSAQDVALKPVRLDGLTVVDDHRWVKGLGKSKNLPDEMKEALKEAYA
jgi:cytosine/adenosine deaminase-related metal-dependent hydrolase